MGFLGVSFTGILILLSRAISSRPNYLPKPQILIPSPHHLGARNSEHELQQVNLIGLILGLIGPNAKKVLSSAHGT